MFEITIMVLIVANMLTMMVEYYDQPESYTDILEYINYVFVAIFTGEAIMKVNIWQTFLNSVFSWLLLLLNTASASRKRLKIYNVGQ